MDEEGFIFTTDATLALVVMIVFTASVVTYGLLPVYQGENHQHLEALADSALETMQQDGTLRTAAVEYHSNNATQQQLAVTTLQNELNLLIPNSVAYKMTMENNAPVENDGNVTTAKDIVTKVKVISGPQQGWMGRAYYKVEQVQFVNQNDTQISTLWNFENWLLNFNPWHTNGLQSGADTYWGGTNAANNAPVGIQFAVPGNINSASLLIGSSTTDTSNGKPYSANFVLNGHSNMLLNSTFNYIYTTSQPNKMYNSFSALTPNQFNANVANSFYVNFINATSNSNMPWFSIIANYTTNVIVPQGVQTDTFNLPDIAGIGQNSGNSYLFNLNSGTVTPTTSRTQTWAYFQTAPSVNYDFSTPFRLTGIVGLNPSQGSAVGTQTTLYVPPGKRVFDAYVVVNAYAGTDGVIVQVMDSLGNWHTAFDSFDTQYTNRSAIDGGYGNIPGVVDIQNYITPGNNTVRVISYDESQGGDYDLTGLVDCYAKLTYSALPIGWDTFPFASYQNTSSGTTKTYTGVQSFKVNESAQEALLFLSTGVNTRNITVSIYNGTASSVLYTGVPTYDLDLANLDSINAKHILTTTLANGTVNINPGSYNLSVQVTPAMGWEGGQNGFETVSSYTTQSDPSLFSGTRIAVIYPEFLENVWATGFASTPQQAAQNAITNLTSVLGGFGYNITNTSAIRTSSLYTGDVPNAIPVRLDLWTQ
jgi:hypothetical protein